MHFSQKTNVPVLRKVTSLKLQCPCLAKLTNVRIWDESQLLSITGDR